MLRTILLAGSNYSERALATLVALREAGQPPVACLCRVTLDRTTVARKVAQYGFRGLAGYAFQRVGLKRGEETDREGGGFENPHLGAMVEAAGLTPRTLRAACDTYGVPFAFCPDVNGPESLTFARRHAPDLVVYTGGGILREPLLAVPRLGVLNAHAGVLPEYRGMNVTEWAVLRGDEPGVTVHFIDPGIDTGRIVFVEPVPITAADTSLTRLRSRVVARTVDGLVRGVTALGDGTARPRPQRPEEGRQYFVMHQDLLEITEARLRERAEAV